MNSSKQSVPPPSSGRRSAASYSFALHEVSNALTVVLGWLDLGEKAEDEAELRRAIRVARQHAKRGQHLARSAIGAEVEASRGGQSGGEIASFVSLSVQPSALERGIQIVEEVGPGTEALVREEGSLIQILTNLLLNALQFSPDNSRVQLGVTSDDSGIRFVVQDEGPGVPEEKRVNLFTKPSTTRVGGAGIGLSHSLLLARECGGELLYVPTERGARFDLLWPVSGSTGARSRVRSCEGDALRETRILLIEDDVAVASLVELSCEARGAQIVTAHDLEELNVVLEQDPVFDVVLMDLSPVEHCLPEILDRIGALSPGAPFVLMSGHPDGIPARAEGRFSTWLRKPFDMEQLVFSLVELLGPRSGEA